MGTITARAITDKASVQLLDEAHVRWTELELLSYLNDGQRQTVLFRPEAGATTLAYQLAPGTRQTLPASAHTLLDIPRNLAGGTGPGRAVRVVSREVMDAVDPDWSSATPSATVKNFVYDPRIPTTFYVSPPQPSSSTTGYVELVISKIPADVAITDPIALDDIYAPSLLDYVLYRAYGKDSEFAAEQGLAVSHYNTFIQSLGIFTKEQMLRNPNLMPAPANPQVPAQAR